MIFKWLSFSQRRENRGFFKLSIVEAIHTVIRASGGFGGLPHVVLSIVGSPEGATAQVSSGGAQIY